MVYSDIASYDSLYYLKGYGHRLDNDFHISDN